jgi:serine phosphatase RsbU (regulator of sigma subunit)
VGAFPQARYQQGRVLIEPGAVLALFTDGVVEARRGQDEAAWKGLRSLLEAHAGEDAEAIAQAIFHQAQNQAGGELQDDVAIVAIRLAFPC